MLYDEPAGNYNSTKCCMTNKQEHTQWKNSTQCTNPPTFAWQISRKLPRKIYFKDYLWTNAWCVFYWVWFNFSSETEPPSVFSLYISQWKSDLSHGKCCGFVCLWRFVWFTIPGYLPGTSREIDLTAERIIICCDATFRLKPNRRRCFRCIFRQDALIWAMVNAVASSASDGSFDLTCLDICRAHHKKSFLQRRGSSSDVVQLLSWTRLHLRLTNARLDYSFVKRWKADASLGN
jgi:hypothetical protein